MHLERQLLVIKVRVKLADLVVEKVLLVLESLRAANVLQQEVGEGRRNHAPIFGRQLDSWLRSIVNVEDGRAARRLRRQEVELKEMVGG